MSPSTRYQFVRDRADWDATLLAVERDGDGNLTLARLPGPADGNPVDLAPPWSIGASGIAAGGCDAVFVADTEASRVLFVDGLCAEKAWLPSAAAVEPGGGLGQFDQPRGLAVASEWLWVADSGNGRVQRFTFPTLEIDLEITGLAQPTGVAVDSAGRVYVLEAGAKRVLRYSARGLADSAYNAALDASAQLGEPGFIAVGHDDVLFVSDAAGRTIHCFDHNGAFLRNIASASAGFSPGAVAVWQDRLFVADTASGGIEVFLVAGTHLCPLPNFRGGVTALTVAPNGDLLIKTGLDESYLTFAADAAYAGQGSVVAGPYDAGEKIEWLRAAAEAEVPRGTAVVLEVAQWEAATPPPGAGDWVRAAALDTLLAPLLPPGPPPAARRFLWLRATLSTTQFALTPLLRDLSAETPGEDYRDYLPEIYRRADEPDRFLYRLLALAKSELAAVEAHIDALPKLLAPDFAPASALSWLASWVGLELPGIATSAERRQLIARAIALYRQRGTPAGICDFVEIYTGVRPSLVEAFEERGIWVLGVTSSLGFDTGLPAIDPLGLVVPDPGNPLAAAPDCCPTPIGSAVVGTAGPLPVSEIGEPLFLDTAYRFTVFLPAYRADDAALRAEVRRVIDAEKPAHTDYHLCLVEPDFRVGFQSQVGVDTIVGGPPPPLRLGATRLGLETNLPEIRGDAGRVGQRAQLGSTTVLG